MFVPVCSCFFTDSYSADVVFTVNGLKACTLKGETMWDEKYMHLSLVVLTFILFCLYPGQVLAFFISHSLEL